MLESLEWTTIENRRRLQRLTTLHKILHNLIDIDPDRYIRPKEYRSRRGHEKQFTLFQCTSTQFQESFFPESVALWNALPQQAVSITSSDIFKTTVQASDIQSSLRPHN